MKSRVRVDNETPVQVVLIRVDRAHADGDHPRHRHAPLDLLWVRQQLGDAKVAVELVDLWLPQAEQRLSELLSMRPAIAVLKADSGCSEQSRDLAAALQRQGWISIAVGHQVHQLRSDMRIEEHSPWDFALLGEPELALPELLAALLASPLDLASLQQQYQQRLIQGAAFQVDQPDQLPSIRLAPSELDAYPFTLPVPGRAVRRWGYVQTAWGCPYDCSHCTELVRKSSGRSLRLRSIARVLADIQALQAAGADGIIFEDDTLLCHKAHFLALCQGLDQAGITLPWIANARPDELCAERVEAAARSGAVLFKLGIESGSVRQVEQIGKARSGLRWVEQTRAGVALMQRHGIAALGLMLVGLPDETEDDIAQTQVLLDRLPLLYLQLQLFTAYADVTLTSAQARSAEGNLFHYQLIGRDTDPCLDPPRQSAQLQQRRLYRRFYLSPRWLLRHLAGCWRSYLQRAVWRRGLGYARYVLRQRAAAEVIAQATLPGGLR